ncbi:hypothetical protein NCC49_005385 [Naganishia albida]|nr:hypothetical protein NCC49_005385 [Naganishia albida]
MPSPTIITAITFPILFTITTYTNYRARSLIPRHGPFEPYLSILLHLIVQLPTLSYLWGFDPVIVKRFSSLAGPAAAGGEIDAHTRAKVDDVLASYQTSCVFLVGTAIVPFTWIAAYTKDPHVGAKEYQKVGLWVLAAFTCGISLRRESTFFLMIDSADLGREVWTAVYKENQGRIDRLVNTAVTAARDNTPGKAMTSEEKVQQEGTRHV